MGTYNVIQKKKFSFLLKKKRKYIFFSKKTVFLYVWMAQDLLQPSPD